MSDPQLAQPATGGCDTHQSLCKCQLQPLLNCARKCLQPNDPAAHNSPCVAACCADGASAAVCSCCADLCTRARVRGHLCVVSACEAVPERNLRNERGLGVEFAKSEGGVIWVKMFTK